MSWSSATLQALRELEASRDEYLLRRDPIPNIRLGWRARAVRNLVHLKPSDHILELGAGAGLFTRHLEAVSRKPDNITAVRFAEDGAVPVRAGGFDVIVVSGMLDERTAIPLLQVIHDRLAPGGQAVFFESNPWNPLLQARRMVLRNDIRRLESRTRLYEQMSEVGFIEVFAVLTDFMYRPLTPRFIWLMRNISLVFENTPVVRRMAGSILLFGRKPPKQPSKPEPIIDHPELRGRVSVVLPCHNEEQNLRPLVAALLGYYGAYIKQIVVVNDNSTDATGSILDELATDDPRVVPVHRAPPGGVGAALRDGFRAADGDWILSMDCDFQHLLPDLRELFDAASRGHDLVTGSRFSRESVLLRYPLAKIIANRAFHLAARHVLGTRCRDLTNNLRLVRREVIERVPITEDGFAANAEIGFLPLMMGYSVCEVPISWINRGLDMGTSSFDLARVGGGYWRVLGHLAARRIAGRGRYAELVMPKRPVAATARR